MIIHLKCSKIFTVVLATTEGSFFHAPRRKKKKLSLISKGILSLKNNYTKDAKIKKNSRKQNTQMYFKYLVMKMQFSFPHNVLKPGKNLSKFSLILISNAHT